MKKILAILLAALKFSAGLSAEEKQLSVYSPVAVYTLPVLQRAGRDYVGLLELLEPLGRVTSESKGVSLKLRYNAVDAEFVAGKTRAKIRGRDLDLAAPFLIENSRGLVPLNSVSGLLPLFLGSAVNFHESARRLFVGSVAIQISFKLDPATPPKLALNFSAPVNPTISTEPGKLRLVFKRDPVVSPGSQSIAFDNKIITQAIYSENSGDAELDITATQPLMASFSNDRKAISVAVIPPATPASKTTIAATPQGTKQQSPASAVNVHRVLVVVDPAHGGDERGAALTDTLAEKDVTLGFARLLRHELETRGFAVTLLRDTDIGLTLDQRAAETNVAHAGIYIALHAASQGNAVGVYTSLPPIEGPSKGAFRAWNAAQSPSLPMSRTVSTAIAAEMQKKQFSVRASSASLRPLNNVLMPAVAVELTPGSNGISDLTSANYQQKAASAIADAVASVRDKLGAQP